MAAKGVPFKRACEQDFDLMAALVSDETYWCSARAEASVEYLKEPQTEQKGSLEIEGILDVSKAMSDVYNGELYEEQTEGIVDDTYVPDAVENEIPQSVKKRMFVLMTSIPNRAKTADLRLKKLNYMLAKLTL